MAEAESYCCATRYSISDGVNNHKKIDDGLLFGVAVIAISEWAYVQRISLSIYIGLE